MHRVYLNAIISWTIRCRESVSNKIYFASREDFWWLQILL